MANSKSDCLDVAMAYLRLAERTADMTTKMKLIDMSAHGTERMMSSR